VSDEALLERAFLDEAVIEAGWRAPAAVLEAALGDEAELDADAGLAAHVRRLGEAGVLALLVDGDDGGRFERVAWRAVCLARERLAHASPLLELAFTMQGLGSYPITLAGSREQRRRWLPDVLRGERVAAFALTEPGAGSDLSGLSTRAERDGDAYVLTGEKVYITNAPIAGLFTVLARTAPPGERRGVSAFVVPRETPGVRTEAQRVLGEHPIGRVFFEGARVPASQRLGEEGHGMRVALGTLHRFRPTVGAAALGMGQRALDEALAHSKRRKQFGAPLAALQAVQMSLAESACDLEAARLLVYRAAALADAGAGRAAEAKAGSMAKLMATEAAFRVIDRAVQLHGGLGVEKRSVVAKLYEDIRALRIYEGASDVQKVVIARHLLGE
jgi:acyl-CoA dehydrogenase